MTWQNMRPTAKEISIAAISLVIVVGAAFLVASLTLSKEIFPLSLTEEMSKNNFGPNQRLDLHQTHLTAWAALILVTPALCTFLFRRTSEAAARYWLAFWTVSYIAFLVHFYWAVVVLFRSNWSDIFQADKRVSLPIIDTIVTVWWGGDVLLAWLIQSEKAWIRSQRIVLHLAVFGLFFAGSAIQGNIFWSKALGFAMGAAVLGSVIYWLILKKRTPTARLAQSA